ncbi:MAG: sensor histidine kinase [Sphingomonas sp.]
MTRATPAYVLAKDGLAGRPRRAPDADMEAAAFAGLAAALSMGGDDGLKQIGAAIVAAGLADAAGVMVPPGGAPPLSETGRAQQLSGAPEPTLIGLTSARGAALLFEQGGQPDGSTMPPDSREMLVLPLGSRDAAAGVLWAARSDRSRQFDAEDLRLLDRLGALVAALDGRPSEGDAAGRGKQSGEIVDDVPVPLWRASDHGVWSWCNRRWTDLTGQDVATANGRGWLDALHPEDRGDALRVWRLAAQGGQPFEADYRIRTVGTGEYRWFQLHGAAVRDAGGAIDHWAGSAVDVDRFKRLSEEEKSSRLELQRRVRNTLAVVRSIARRTAENSDSIETFQMRFDGRLSAYARAQSLIAHEPNRGADLETLVAEELLAHHVNESERVTIAGPPVRLQPKSADLIGLAIHELTINAVEHGGLSSEAGQVSVTWSTDASGDVPMLDLDWHDIAPDRPPPRPVRHGFGREMIERNLAYDLDAETELTFGADGVRCRIRLPLDTPSDAS